MNKVSQIHEKLAKIHANYDIYPQKKPNNLIFNEFKNIKSLHYLQRFYEDYLTVYYTARKGSNREKTSVDLPFLGPKVIENGKAKYFFIFEGSLTPPKKRLSVTVFSCFWVIDEINKYGHIFSEFWNSNPYFYIKENMEITTEKANQSYVTDAKRVKGRKRNRELISEEINLLKPDEIIRIGNEARDTIGVKSYKGNHKPSCWHHIPFPTPRNCVKDKVFTKNGNSVPSRTPIM